MLELHNASKRGDLNSVKRLINSNKINQKDNEGCTPLYHAVNGEHIYVLKFLMENGADVDLYDQNDVYPLHVASKQGNLEIVEILTQKTRVCFNVRNKYTFTPVQYAMFDKHNDVSLYLVNKGAIAPVQVDFRTKTHVELNESTQLCVRVYKSSLLHMACYVGLRDVCKALIAKDSSLINKEDNYRKKPLYYAAQGLCSTGDDLGKKIEYVLIIIDNAEYCDNDFYNFIYEYEQNTKYSDFFSHLLNKAQKKEFWCGFDVSQQVKKVGEEYLKYKKEFNNNPHSRISDGNIEHSDPLMQVKNN